jgi:CheY-like chemotaxis protein
MATILIIDDAPTNRQLLSTILGYQGHRMLEATDGFLVMERFKARPRLAGIPVIVVSARDPAVNRERALQSGASAFFQKPADNDELMAAISKRWEGSENVDCGMRIADFRISDSNPQSSIRIPQFFHSAIRNPQSAMETLWLKAKSRD